MLLLSYLFFLLAVQAQKTISLQNPSFEWDEPQSGKAPSGWIDLGMEGETPPDIQPGSWGLRMKAKHGTKYVGLVVRDNYTWEGIGQVLEERMIQDSAYTFSLNLAYWSLLVSYSRITGTGTFYSAPTVLRIWGVNTVLNKRELLAESDVIDHLKWLHYTFTLKPKKSDCDRIELVAYYAPGKELTNGTLLMDNCSDIQLKQ